jgi:8-oxo-dGTP pyrophosphatase MutT (NUDIX family)
MIDESWYRRPVGVPEHDAAGGIVARAEGDRFYVALVHESGLPLYFLPKGKVEAGENLEEAARREIEEEAGLSDLTLVGDLGERQRLDYAKRAWKKTRYFLFTTSQIDGVPTDRKHHYELEWHPLDNLPRLFWPEQQDLLVAGRRSLERMLGWGQE